MKTKGLHGFDVVNTIIMLIIAFCTLFPFWYVVVGSLNVGEDFMKGGVYFFPRIFTLENYKVVMTNADIYSAYLVTIMRTLLGTPLHILVCFAFAYSYSRIKISGKKFYTLICMIPMFISGGAVPYYQVIVTLKLNDTFWVYLLPNLFSFWDVLIIKSFLSGVSTALDESAKIEGADDFQIMFHIILPLSGSVIAALAVFTAVGNWNAYYDSMVFMPWRKELRTLQHIVLIMIQEKEYITGQLNASIQAGAANTITTESLQYATIIVVTLPIIVIYPFMQKYFIKGVLIGSVKG